MAEHIMQNKFDPQKTKTILIHDGRFHADDMMFAAMAQTVAAKYKNHINIQRVGELPEEYSAEIVAGDVGYGVYDHHTDKDGLPSLGNIKNTDTRMVSACGLLYEDIKDLLFSGESETKAVFEALLDVIEHCDNTPDKNTFADSINMLVPMDNTQMDESAQTAIKYCREIVEGFIKAHNKERAGAKWAVPKVFKGIVPGAEEQRESRYWKAPSSLRNRYKYISFNNEREIKLKAIDTYSLTCGVLSHEKRQSWRHVIEESDRVQIAELTKREKEEWPLAVSKMKHKTISIEHYISYSQFVKDIDALFVVSPSQRKGYSINLLKTNGGKYRFEPSLLLDFPGCCYVANDQRFISFETKEQALNAAYAAGEAVEQYLEKYGFAAYRDIYGGCAKEYSGDMYVDVISEDVTLNIYVREHIKDPNNLTVAEYRQLQIAVMDNPYLTHVFCKRFCSSGEKMSWDFTAIPADKEHLSPETLWTKNRNGIRWDMGLSSYLKTTAGQNMYQNVFPSPLTIERTRD